MASDVHRTGKQRPKRSNPTPVYSDSTLRRLTQTYLETNLILNRNYLTANLWHYPPQNPDETPGREKWTKPRPAKEPDTDNLSQRRGDIERLWLEGLSTHEIADALGIDPRSVGQNLRALRNRRKRAAARPLQEVVTMTQCATIFREAMDGWERSQQPKCTKTEERKNVRSHQDRDACREVQGPRRQGASCFAAAQCVAKRLRHLRSRETAQVGRTGRYRTCGDFADILTPERAERFTHAQLTRAYVRQPLTGEW